MFKSAVSEPALCHIKIDHHFVREHVVDGDGRLMYIAAALMIADIMTKALFRIVFQQHTDSNRYGKL